MLQCSHTDTLPWSLCPSVSRMRQSNPFARALAGSGAAPPSSPPCSMAPHAAVGTRNMTAHLHYCPPFQPWGLLHGIAVTVSGVLFWVGVWDILDYAVLPRGWPWRVRARPAQAYMSSPWTPKALCCPLRLGYDSRECVHTRPHA